MIVRRESISRDYLFRNKSVNSSSCQTLLNSSHFFLIFKWVTSSNVPIFHGKRGSFLPRKSRLLFSTFGSAWWKKGQLKKIKLKSKKKWPRPILPKKQARSKIWKWIMNKTRIITKLKNSFIPTLFSFKIINC